MSIIRRLVIFEWFKFFNGAFVLLLLLLTIANLISGFLRVNVTPWEVILNHLIEMPASLKKILPISCLVASLFSINKLKSRSELTAIFSIGYSRKQYIFDLIICATIVASLQFISSSFLEPFIKSNKDHLIANSESKFRNLKRKGLLASTISSGHFWYKDKNYFLSFDAFDKANYSIKNAVIYQFSGSLIQKITFGKEISWVDNAWRIHQGVNFLNLHEEKTFPSIHHEKDYVPYLNLTPDDFLQLDSDITTLNIFNLRKYITKLKSNQINTNEYEVLFYEKISTSLICIIFAIISALPIFNPNRRNSSFGRSVVFIFVFTIFYWLINSYFIELGKSSKLNPILSCFGVHVLFTLFLIKVFHKNRQLN